MARYRATATYDGSDIPLIAEFSGESSEAKMGDHLDAAKYAAGMPATITLTSWDQVQHYELERLVRQAGHHGKTADEPDACEVCFMLRALRMTTLAEGATIRVAAAIQSRRVELAVGLR